MLRDLSSREAILTDLAMDGEHITPDIVDKYKLAARICNACVAKVVEAVKVDEFVWKLCELGDSYIEEQLASVYTQGQVEKGPAFPACISINNCVGYFSPLQSDTTKVKHGDVVKISMGVQIDGYVSYGGHTVVVGTGDVAVQGRAGDVVAAARDAAIIVHAMLRPDVEGPLLTQTIERIAKTYNCNPLHNVTSYSMKRFVPLGRKRFSNRSDDEVMPNVEKIEPFKIVDGEVYDVNIMMSTGEGKHRAREARSTVFQRDLANNFQLRTKSGRGAISDISKRFPTMPFSLRQLEPRSLLGIRECLSHGLLAEFEPTFEKEGELVAQFRFTAMVHNGKTICLSNHAIQATNSQYSVSDENTRSLLNAAKNKPLSVSKWTTNSNLLALETSN